MRSLQQWHEDSLKVEQALRHLHLLIADAGLYSDDHPKFKETLSATVAAWRSLLREAQEVELKQIGSDLVFQDIALQGSLSTTKEFIQGLKERGIECLVFQPGFTQEEMLAFIHCLRLLPARRNQIGDPGRYLLDRGVRHVQIWSLADLVHDRESKDGHKVQGLPIILKDLRAFRKDCLRVIGDLHQEAKVARVLDLDVACGIVNSFLREFISGSGLMAGLSSIRTADEYTCTHSLNTCVLSVCMGRHIGMEQSIVADLGISCLLHDIGKMFIPDAILNKPSRLTSEEWAIMEDHTTLGARFLLSVPDMVELAPIVAYEHHMNFDGSGYPRPRKRHSMNLASHIASLADFYDALSTARPYKRALPPGRVVEMLGKMEDSGREPRLKQLFLDMVGQYPIGTVVRLNTGELAVVSMKNAEDPLRPEVYIVTDPDGKHLQTAFPLRLGDTEPESARRSIQESMDPLEAEVDPLEVLQKVLSAPIE